MYKKLLQECSWGSSIGGWERQDEREGRKPGKVPLRVTIAGSWRKHLECKLCLSSPDAKELGFLTPSHLGHW